MKKIMFLATLCLFALSCSNETIESELNEVINSEKATAPVTVRVNGFSITQEDFPDGGTRAEQDVVDYTGVGAIDLAFYSGETEVYKTTQLRSNTSSYTTFGEFACNLPIGTYTMVVVGRGYFTDDVFTLTSPTVAAYTSERARETFCATQSVTVTAAGVDVSVTLSRIMAKLVIQSSDVVPDGVTNIRTTYAAGSKGFNPSTGLATSNTGFIVTNTANKGTDNKLNTSSFVFLASDEQTMNITIEALNANNDVLYTKVVPNVSLKRNRQTYLLGVIFTVNASAAINVETEWIDPYVVHI